MTYSYTYNYIQIVTVEVNMIQYMPLACQQAGAALRIAKRRGAKTLLKSVEQEELQLLA